MLTQKELTLSDSPQLVIIQELDSTKALEFGALLGTIMVGSFDGMADFGGDVEDTEIHLGKVVKAPIERLLNKEFAANAKELIKASVIQPDYSEDWFNDRFSARNMPALFELLKEIIEFNFSPVAEILKKKMPFGIVQAFFHIMQAEQPNQSDGTPD